MELAGNALFIVWFDWFVHCFYKLGLQHICCNSYRACLVTRCPSGLLERLNLMLWSFKVKRANYRADLSDTHHIFHHLHNEAMEVWGMTFSLCVCVWVCREGGGGSGLSEMMSWLLGKFCSYKRSHWTQSWVSFLVKSWLCSTTQEITDNEVC